MLGKSTVFLTCRREGLTDTPSEWHMLWLSSKDRPAGDRQELPVLPEQTVPLLWSLPAVCRCILEKPDHRRTRPGRQACAYTAGRGRKSWPCPAAGCKARPNQLQQGRMRTEALVALGAFCWGILYHQKTVLETPPTYTQKMRENA